MEYFNLVLESILHPFLWLARIWTADEFLWGALMALFCANLIVKLYLRPFLAELSGSDKVGKKSKKGNNSGGDEE